MLVLTRRKGQRILIGDDIRLTVNRIGDDRVSIGIEAPREVRVVREEIADKKGGAK